MPRSVLSSTIFVILVGFVNTNNIVRWIKAGFEISRQEKQIRKYAGEIEQMDDRIRSLTSSRDSLEKFAREYFHFAEPGDDVFIIEDKK